MDTLPLPQLPDLQHHSANGEDRTGPFPHDFFDPAYSPERGQYRDILLRELLTADIKAELLDAMESIATSKSLVVSPGFEFWRRHHPELLSDLAPIIEDAWCSVVRYLEAERDRSSRDFTKKILQAIPHPADPAPWIERATAALNRGMPQRIRTFDLPPAPLTPADFLKPFAFDDKEPMVALRRMYPTVLRDNIGFECGKGWLQLLDGFLRWLESIAIEIKEAGVRAVPIAVQIKEKFGRLQIYVQGIPAELRDELFARKQQVLDASGSTCEACGKPGTMRNVNADGRGCGWVHVYCDPCEAEYQRGLSDD
jgi:hypothetical protein